MQKEHITAGDGAGSGGGGTTGGGGVQSGAIHVTGAAAGRTCPKGPALRLAETSVWCTGTVALLHPATSLAELFSHECSYYVVLCMQGVLIMQCFICKVS